MANEGQSNTGAIAWSVLVAYIISYDIVALKSNRPTLSAAFYRATHWRVSRALLIAFWGYLTAHLFRWMPEKYDLFRRAFGA